MVVVRAAVTDLGACPGSNPLEESTNSNEIVLK